MPIPLTFEHYARETTMLKTILILILTLVIVPVVSFYFDQPLDAGLQGILLNVVWIYLGVALTCFVVSELTRNCSQVDKIWSIMPIVYAWYIAYAGGLDPRSILMAALVTLWGVRLTYNFSRRGAYTWKFWSGEEDYRWEVLRQKPMFQSRVAWVFFNLFFISLYQQGLILLFTLPILLALQGAETPLGWLDYTAAALFVAFVVIETVADQQQWNFQQAKYRRIKAGVPLGSEYGHGFTNVGLWAWMRHPNYMAEQAIWICFYLFSVAATGRWLNWSIAGCLLLVVLFQGSSNFSEEISARKYPAYKDYQRRVGRFIPKFW
jgi:steroid 5-alpha reductase family enzyme